MFSFNPMQNFQHDKRQLKSQVARVAAASWRWIRSRASRASAHCSLLQKHQQEVQLQPLKQLQPATAEAATAGDGKGGV